MRLIDADKLDTVTLYDKNHDFISGAEYILDIVDLLPTMVDLDALHIKLLTKLIGMGCTENDLEELYNLIFKS